MKDTSVRHMVIGDPPMHDPQDIIDAVNLCLDWCQDNMREPAFFSLDVDKRNFVTGVIVRAE